MSNATFSLVDVVLAIAAVLALVISIASMGLQYYLWHVSGAKLRIILSSSYLVYEDHIDSRARLSINLSNQGRAEIQILNLWIKPKGDPNRIVFTKYETGSASLPAVLKPGFDLNWYLPLDDVHAELSEHGLDRYKVVAGLPGGRELSSKWQNCEVGKFRN
jgi:hypothetical protein